LLIGFSLLRPANKVVYQPRLKYAPEKVARVDGRAFQIITYQPTSIFFPALPKGLDAVMFLRFLRFCVQLIGGLSIFGIALCIFHYYAPRIDGDNQQLNNANGTLGLLLLSMSNVDPNSNWFWLHASLSWVFSIYAYFLLYNLWSEYTKFRKQWFATDDFRSGYFNRTLLLTNLSESMRTSDAVIRFIKSLNLKYPMSSAAMGREIGELPKLVKEHEKYTLLLEKALGTYLKDPNNLPAKRPTHKEDATLGLGGEKVDTIDFSITRLRVLEEQIYGLRSKGDAYFAPNASAFVSFESIKGANSAARKLENSAAIRLRSNTLNPPSVKLSPDFDDIVWQNLGIPIGLRMSRQAFAVVSLMGVTVGWTFFITFLGTITSLSTIKYYSQSLANWIESHPAATVILQSFIAPLLLVLASSFLLPVLLRVLSRIQGVLSGTGVEKSVMHKFFAFQVYQIIFLIAGTTIANALLRPSNGTTFQSVAEQASLNFVNKANFYTSQITLGYATIGIEIIQGYPLVMKFLLRRFASPTPRQEFELNKPPVFEEALQYGSLLMTLLISLAYSIVNPLILPFAFLHFLLFWLVYKYQLVYVCEYPSKRGG
ncbi:hypothetical protein BDK51DRAFT_11862, partial [Blyttiomyces helicus]